MELHSKAKTNALTALPLVAQLPVLVVLDALGHENESVFFINGSCAKGANTKGLQRQYSLGRQVSCRRTEYCPYRSIVTEHNEGMHDWNQSRALKIIFTTP